ncbi:MAG TPA: peptidoglycan recognition family protein [Hyphomicrobiaceae bacterium]|nr:peptidoglycan recognition family protein [Hyphomicrobiaceae bacterium]
MRPCAPRHGIRAGLGLALALALTMPGASAQDRPEIVPRFQWGAKPANVEMMTPQTPREIVIHHTGTRQHPKLSLERKLRSLQSFSQHPGTVNGRTKAAWGDLPYHFYIDATGRIGEGRDVGYAGDTNTAYSTANRIQIVMEGQFDDERPSTAQLDALDRLVAWLAARYRVPADKISGHNDHAPTACPGKHLKAHLPALIEKVKAIGASRAR